MARTGGIQVGAHVSSSGGLFNAIDRALAIEAEACQIFVSAPQTWRPTKHTDAAIRQFRERRAETGFGQVWIHNIYLANLASEDPLMVEKSIASVVNSMTVGAAAGVDGVVLHTGSHKGLGMEAVLDRVVDALHRVLKASPAGPVLALETMAGQGGTIGTRFADLGMLLRAVDSPRLATCLDTCHSFAAGYNIRTKAGLEAAVAEYDREIGLDRLAVVHANDSKVPLGGFRDRHENIGDGYLGTEGFEVLMAHPAFQGKAFLLEVPGYPTEKNPKGDGPDLENVRRLKAIRDRVPVAR